MNLFCIPYAGGSAKIIFNGWQQALPSSIKVIPLELAGHGVRIDEPFHGSIEATVADIVSAIKSSVTAAPYAIYGHSMGSLIAYELTKALNAAGLPAPKTVFLSGRKPPHNCSKPRNIHRYNDTLLLEEMKKLGGTPKVFFEVKELVKAFLPIFRNDYRILELYQFVEPIRPTSADIVFFHSDGDAVVEGPEVNEWAKYTTGLFTRKNFQGGHFFINDNRQAICDIISEYLESEAEGNLLQCVAS
jgi:medium-chain acyl-[acyl-carrier-protein] hydrolase